MKQMADSEIVREASRRTVEDMKPTEKWYNRHEVQLFAIAVCAVYLIALGLVIYWQPGLIK